MEVSTILESLDALGVSVRVSGTKLLVEPGSRVPKDIVDALHQHKAEIMEYLMNRYRQVYPGDDGPGLDELLEIESRLQKDGYVLLWSNVLDDLVAFYETEEDRKKIPPGFEPYSEQELRTLFGLGRGAPSPNSLRFLHKAKKLGCRIVASQPQECDGDE